MTQKPDQSPPANAESGNYFYALDALRGFLALFIIVYHWSAFFFLTPLNSLSWLQGVYVTVDAFFVLSGFVITHTLWSRSSSFNAMSGFMIRRFFRLWPLHVCVLFGLLGLHLYMSLHNHHGALFHPPYSLSGFFSALLMLQSMGLYNYIPWNGPSWSISTEFYTYLLLALVWWGVGQRRLVLVAVVFSLSSFLLVISSPSPSMYITYDLGFFRCVYGFFVGVLVYVLYLSLHQKTFYRRYVPHLQWLFLLLLPVYVLLGLHNRASFMAPVVFSVFVLVFAAGRSATSGFLENPVFRFLSRTSYSSYLIHSPLLICLTQLMLALGAHRLMSPTGAILDPRVMLSGQATVWTLALSLALIFFCANLSYQLIEKPGQALGKRLSRRYAESDNKPIAHETEAAEADMSTENPLSTD